MHNAGRKYWVGMERLKRYINSLSQGVFFDRKDKKRNFSKNIFLIFLAQKNRKMFIIHISSVQFN
jgi:hypothetical protein